MTIPHRVRTLVVLAVLGLTTFAVLPSAAPAATATKCGKKVLADWFDNGRIDRLYNLNCYEEAIDQIPPDIGPYSDAEDVITRALQAALNGKLAPGGPDPTPGDDGSGGGNPGDPDGTPEGASGVDTSAPSSVPIPLLVLGGMSIALLAAGGLGYLSRRRQAADADEPGDDDPLT